MSNVEELMKPRVKVTAPYPGSKIPVGTILVPNRFDGKDNGQWVTTDPEDKNCLYGFDPLLYPHLFKPLEWWEERDKNDMPMYLKQTGMVNSSGEHSPDWYLKIRNHFQAGNGEWRDNSYNIFCAELDYRTTGIGMSYASFFPATETEYNEYLKTKL